MKLLNMSLCIHCTYSTDFLISNYTPINIFVLIQLTGSKSIKNLYYFIKVGRNS